MIIALLEYLKDDIELVYADSYKRHCYPILASFMVDYKKQVFIIGIKVNMQCLICHISLKEKELL